MATLSLSVFFFSSYYAIICLSFVILIQQQVLGFTPYHHHAPTAVRLSERAGTSSTSVSNTYISHYRCHLNQQMRLARDKDTKQRRNRLILYESTSSSSSSPSPVRAVDSQTQKLLEKAAKLKAEAEALQSQLLADNPELAIKEEEAKKKRVRFSSEEIKAEVSKALEVALRKRANNEGDLNTMKTPYEEQQNMKQVTLELETLKEKNILKKYNSDSMAYRKYSGDQFKQTSGISPQEIESGAALNDYKYALGAVLAVSTLCIFLSIAIGGFYGSLFVYLFALVPITFIGIGSISPGIISAAVVLLYNAIDEQKEERECTYYASRFLVGYLKGLPIQSVTKDEKKGYTKVNFYDTPKGSFNVVNMANEMATNVEGPSLPETTSRRVEISKEEILPYTALALTGSVNEKIVTGKVIDRLNDFIYLDALMAKVNDPKRLNDNDRNDLSLYAAMAAYRTVNNNKYTIQQLTKLVQEGKELADLIACVETAD